MAPVLEERMVYADERFEHFFHHHCSMQFVSENFYITMPNIGGIYDYMIIRILTLGISLDRIDKDVIRVYLIASKNTCPNYYQLSLYPNQGAGFAFLSQRVRYLGSRSQETQKTVGVMG